MDKKNEHIDLLTPEIIKAYHAGKLSPAQMHQVEVLMLENPLYSEGMEGISSIDANDFTQDMQLLNDKLDKKAETKKGGFWNIYTRAAAVTLLLVSSIGLFYLTNTSELPTKELSSLKTEKENERDSSNQTNKTQTPTALAADSIQSEQDVPLSAPAKPIVEQMVAEAKPKDDSQSAVDREPIQETLRGKVDGVKVAPSATETALKLNLKDKTSKGLIDEQNESLNRAIALKESTEISKLKSAELTTSFTPQNTAEASNGLTIQGTIRGADDSLALPQVAIFVKGSLEGTNSSEDGKYELNNLLKGSTVIFRYIGYETKEIQVDSSGTIDVKLEIDRTSLGEVVVVARGISRDKKSLGYSIDDATKLGKVSKPKPIGGFSAYRKYLKGNIRYPETARAKKIRGRVTLEFEVSASGELSNFKIVKGLGYGCDEEAIRLVQEGPQWIPKTEGPDMTPVSSTVRVKVRFRP